MNCPLKFSVLHLILVLYIALPPSTGMRLYNGGSATSSENKTANESETPDEQPTTPGRQEIFGSLQLQQPPSDNSENYTYLITGVYRPTNYTSAEYLVSISTGDIFSYFNKKQHFCAGAIIKSNAVLTGAHCLRLSRIASFFWPYTTIVAGHSQKRSARTHIPHPNYHRYRLQSDIAIVVLDRALELNDKVKTIPLPMQPIPPGTVCTVVGWNKSLKNGPHPSAVFYVDVNILPSSLCMQIGTICVGNVHPNKVIACSGESGGLLICAGTIAGIKTHSSDCEIPGCSAVYTDVYQFIGWISNYENQAAKGKPAAVALYVVASLAVWCVL